MISLLNPAFDFLRKYKPCEQHTEELVMKKIRGSVSNDELITIFEKGVMGEYGKFIVADPQTLLGWVASYKKRKASPQNYLSTGLLNVNTGVCDQNYPGSTDDWFREANKCFTAFLNGVSASNFHPHVYDRMMLDGKIQINAYKDFFESTGNVDEDVKRAKQKELARVFLEYKKRGWRSVYIIPSV